MVLSIAGNGRVARARANRASSCQISLLSEAEDVWSRFQAAETTSQATVPTEPEAAQNLLALWEPRSRGELDKCCDPEPRPIGAEVLP